MAGRRKSFGAAPPIPVSTIPVAVAGDPYVIEIIDTVEGASQLRFERWIGHGIDPWVHALIQQLRVFLQGKTVTKRTVSAYGRTGVMYFLEFLVSTRATYAPGEINRRRIEQFIEWLKAHSTAQKASTQKTIYSNVKSVLKGLARRGLVPNQSDLFPTRQFPRSALDIDGAEPLSQGERARLADALRRDVIRLHHEPGEFNDADALVVYAVSLSLRTGLNTSPMLELKRDALRRHPFLPKMGLLTSFKRRKHTSQWMTLVGGEPIMQTAAVPMDGIALFNKLLERTAALAESAPPHLRNVLWLFRTASRNKRGNLRRLTSGVLYERVGAFVRRHKIYGDDGELLSLNNRRLRATMENRLWKLSNGDLFTVAQLMGHDPKVADQSYLAVTDEMRAHATIVGEALPDIYRTDGTADGNQQPAVPRIESTPVGNCKDSVYGEKAPRDGVNHCMDFLSCFRCRSYAVVGSRRDLHRLFSFYWFIDGERTRITSRQWRDHFAYLMSLIDAFTLDKFDNALIEEVKAWAKKEPLKFWRNYQMPYSSGAADAG